MVLECKNVSIRYIVGDFKNIGLKEWVVRQLKKNYKVQEFWAVDGVSFSLEKGDMLGIVGTNGAGKSTLLKAVTGIMEPTKGRVVRNGSLAALLELASGFDGDLTVKENAYLRGAMLGYTRKFMDEVYEEIIDFAELKAFEDRPFKQLSSGMKSRLAFSIASLVHPDILILDEVLSVGDGAFRKKSEEKMRDIMSKGATTILVSHSLNQIKSLCNKVLWLDRGKQIAFGDCQIICSVYQDFLDKKLSLKQAKKKISILQDHYDYLIVGAGLFGSVFAYEAKKQGKKCLVIDKRETLGGNVFCEDVAGITVHKYGAHIFHTSNEAVWNYVNRFVSFNNYVHTVKANYKGQYYSLPFNMHTFEEMWGVKTAQEAKQKIESQKQVDGSVSNLEQQAVSMVGRDIFNKLVKGYTEKQWGKSAAKLPASIIKRIPLRFEYDNRYFADPYQGIPKDGYNPLIKKLLKGTPVLLGLSYSEIKKLCPNISSKIVYTGGIDEYFDYSLGALAYRSLSFDTQILQQEDYQGCAVMNYTDSETPYTRIIEHKHFMPENEAAVTIVTKEYPLKWIPEREPYYPINDDRNNQLYQEYRLLAEEQEGVIFGGRLGEYRYYNMDEVIASALKLAQKEFSKASD